MYTLIRMHQFAAVTSATTIVFPEFQLPQEAKYHRTETRSSSEPRHLSHIEVGFYKKDYNVFRQILGGCTTTVGACRVI